MSFTSVNVGYEWTLSTSGDVFGGGRPGPATPTTDEDGNEIVEPVADTFLNSISFEDGFSDIMGLSIEIEFWETARRSILLGFSYLSADGENVALGTFENQSVRGTFSDYSAMELYAGIRYVFADSSWFQPYIVGQIGYQKTDSINLTFQGSSLNSQQVRLFETSDSLLAEGSLGILIRPSDFFWAGIEAGYAYTTNLSSTDNELEALGIGFAAADGKMSRIPVKVFLSISW